MRVTVGETVCQGHTLCHMAAPDVFELRDEDGHAYVQLEVVPSALEGSVRAAAATCPEGAIEVAE